MISSQLFDKLEIRDHDILLLRTEQSDEELEPMVEILRCYIVKTALQNVVLITLKPGESLRAIDAHLMLMSGWRKITEDDFP